MELSTVKKSDAFVEFLCNSCGQETTYGTRQLTCLMKNI